MADTTPAKVKAIAKHLNKVEDPTLQMYIDDAKLELADKAVPETYEEKLQRYLAAHFATIDFRRPQTQRIGDLQTSYTGIDTQATSDPGLESTQYGQEYKRLWRKINGIRMVVL